MSVELKIKKLLKRELVRFGEVLYLGENTNWEDVYNINSTYDNNGHLQYRYTKEFALWDNMITRCYSSNFQKKYPSYIGVTIKGNFRDFSSFKNWLIKNGFYQHENLSLDSDILNFNGDKTYSENSCILIPNDLNKNLTSFTKAFDSKMTSTTLAGKYQLKMNINSNITYFQCYQDQEEYINNYRYISSYKIIKYIELYKNNMPTISYNKIINSKFYEFVTDNANLINEDHKKIIDKIIK